ncbi:MAG: T9SS type A sorting domain-containing protein [Chitinophagales bacterium]|nr:T9SS type A sorting domain-containing protein [Chitinophagales bacterium]
MKVGTIDLNQQASALHVLVQEVSRKIKNNGTKGIDKVTIVDQDDQPVSGVAVTASYSGPNAGITSATTNTKGIARLTTTSVANPVGMWCFTITDITKDGYTYDPNSNTATTQCENSRTEIVSDQREFNTSALPNPFSSTTAIQFTIPEKQFVTLDVIDINGKQVASLINEEMPAGNNTVSFYATMLSNGIYFYKLSTPKYSEVKKFILNK